MKKLLKNHVFTLLLAAGLAATQISCNSSDNKQGQQDSEAAYNDFSNYVGSVENSAASDTVNWQAASSRSRAEYDAKVAALDQHKEDYDDARHQEIEALKSRYTTYWDKQLAQYNARANSLNGGVAADYRIEGLETTAPANIRVAYENLIANIQANKQNYTHNDWKAINDYYHALDTRKNAVQRQLSDKDKYEIGKAKAQYITMRTAARFDPDVSKAASDVENAAENTGSDIKEGVKTGANKVENAAEEVGSDIKSGAKDLRNKIDRKVDNDPEIK